MTTQNRGFRSQPQRQSQYLSPNLRQSQRQRKQLQRRYPFTESTKIIELVAMRLTERLKPLLKDGETGAFLLTGLFFDLVNHGVGSTDHF